MGGVGSLFGVKCELNDVMVIRIFFCFNFRVLHECENSLIGWYSMGSVELGWGLGCRLIK